MTDPCKESEPRVIDNALIAHCIDAAFPKGELGRLSREEGIPMEEIRFEHQHILKIDHLWCLKSLTKLIMNNNLIEKIENLNTLVHLTELDLSFNKITKIENLDNLVELRKVSFYENSIRTVENMDKQKKLKIFSIGNNLITDKEQVFYFRKFANLTSLNMTGNPCAKEPNFRLFVAASLDQLIYYEYVKIDDTDRQEGQTMFEEILKEYLKIEKGEREISDALEKQEADAKLNAMSFVEYLNTRVLFDKMFENDEEGKAFLELGEDMMDQYHDYETKFLDLCMQIFEVGQKHYKMRQTEIEQFSASVEKAKEHNQKESFAHMETFVDLTNKIFGEIKSAQELAERDASQEDYYDKLVEDHYQTLQENITNTWKVLMKLEMQLFDQLEDINQTFFRALEELINNFIEEAQGIFAVLRSLEVTYAETVSDIAQKFLTSMTVDDVVVPQNLKGIMTDRDAVANAVAATHDAHMQTIDGREDTLVSRARNWHSSFDDALTKGEIKRNRYKVLEINNFLDIKKKEFEKLCPTFEIEPEPIEEYVPEEIPDE